MNNYKLRLLFFAYLIFIGRPVQAQTCGTINLPPIIHACKGGTVLLPTTVTSAYSVYSVTWSPSTGLSDPTILAPTATMGISSTAYTIVVQFEKSTELIQNGDFNLGFSGFTSDYYFMSTPTGVSDHDSFAVGTDPSVYSTSTFPVIGDHTTGTGNMMIVDGAIDSTKHVWCESISVNSATQYLFSFWGNLFNVPDPKLRMTINGTPVKLFDLSGPAGQWVQYKYIFSSGGSTSIDICLYDVTIDSGGNDFALDDISLKELCDTFGGTSVILSDFSPVENFIAKVCKKDVTFFGADSVNLNITGRAWTYGDGNTDTGSTVKHTFPAEGTYTVVFTETDKYGCIDSATAKVGIVTTTKNIKAFGDTTICPGTYVPLLATGGRIYTWNHAHDLNDSTLPAPTALPVAPTHYVVIGIDSLGCTGMDSVFVDFFPPPILRITPNVEPVTCENSSVQLFVAGARKYIWQPGLLFDNNTSSHPVVTPKTTTTFYVTGTDGKGCNGTDSITIICLRDSIYIPNAFTPNGDGHNDVIAPTPYCDFLLTDFSVYNRWGQLMFSTSKVGDAWDGKFSGQPQPQGVYVYEVRGYKVEEGQVSRIPSVIKGNITLLR